MTKLLVVEDSAVDRRLVGELLRRRFECTIEYAASGEEALARMQKAGPDLVLTDLTMPGMNGLELVKSLRVHYPGVPVILMTAYGNEALAMTALERGAASYVPKSHLPEKLADTVEEVLDLARADRSHHRLINCLTESRFVFALENDPLLIDPLVDLVQQMVTGIELVDFTGRLQIGVALKQALLNALFHGNLQISQEQLTNVEGDLLQMNEQSLVERRAKEMPYRDRRVHVEIDLGKDQAKFVVRDEGPGFDTSNVPDASQPGGLEASGHRGLSLIRSFMDEVSFNEKGNEITMIKRRGAGIVE
ncbi:MAG: response regulator [Pirellulales bacterium]|nr:response regulator [Pirellulales bacterium]